MTWHVKVTIHRMVWNVTSGHIGYLKGTIKLKGQMHY